MKNVDTMRYDCPKILPTVYDDSLSYYEVLCKVMYKMNELIEAYNNLDIKPLVEAYLNSIFVNTIYKEDTETIVFSKQKVVSGDDAHVYDSVDNTMYIKEV